MNSNADSEDVLRVGGFYMLLDLTLTFVQLFITEGFITYRKQITSY